MNTKKKIKTRKTRGKFSRKTRGKFSRKTRGKFSKLPLKTRGFINPRNNKNFKLRGGAATSTITFNILRLFEKYGLNFEVLLNEYKHDNIKTIYDHRHEFMKPFDDYIIPGKNKSVEMFFESGLILELIHLILDKIQHMEEPRKTKPKPESDLCEKGTLQLHRIFNLHEIDPPSRYLCYKLSLEKDIVLPPADSIEPSASKFGKKQKYVLKIEGKKRVNEIKETLLITEFEDLKFESDILSFTFFHDDRILEKIRFKNTHPGSGQVELLHQLLASIDILNRYSLEQIDKYEGLVENSGASSLEFLEKFRAKFLLLQKEANAFFEYIEFPGFNDGELDTEEFNGFKVKKDLAMEGNRVNSNNEYNGFGENDLEI